MVTYVVFIFDTDWKSFNTFFGNNLSHLSGNFVLVSTIGFFSSCGFAAISILGTTFAGVEIGFGFI